MVEIGFLSEDDRTEWEALTRRFHRHVGTEISDDLYERTWRRLTARDEIRGVAARLDDRMAGIAHYYFHTGLWHAGRCYLADLFVTPESRRRGIATAIVKWVARDAAEHDSPRLYWNTELDNTAARALYDTVADYKGLIIYSYRRHLSPAPAGGRLSTGPQKNPCHTGGRPSLSGRRICLNAQFLEFAYVVEPGTSRWVISSDQRKDS